MRTLLRLLARLTSRPAPPVGPVACEGCGRLVETACWHRHCPRAGWRPA